MIEEYHKCIKSGCMVEKKQLKTNTRLKNFLGIANVIAVRLLQLKALVKNKPTVEAKKHVDPLKIEILCEYKNIKKENLTIYEYYRLIAKMGGFLGRKSDKEPGWQTIWKGELKLMKMVEGARLILAKMERCG